MSIESGAKDPREEAYRQMEAQKNMTDQPQRGGELPPVLAPENASPEAGEAGGLSDLEKKLVAGTMTPQEAETYASQVLDASPDLLAKLDKIDQLSLPTPEQVNLGLANEADQEKAAKVRQSLIDKATARAVTFYVKEAGKGAYKDLSPEQFVREVRTKLHEVMLGAVGDILPTVEKRSRQRILGK